MKLGFARVPVLLSLVMLAVAISKTEPGMCETTGLEKIDKPIKENELNLEKLQRRDENPPGEASGYRRAGI